MLTLEEVVVNGEGRLVLSQVVPLVRSLQRRLEEDGLGDALLHRVLKKKGAQNWSEVVCVNVKVCLSFSIKLVQHRSGGAKFPRLLPHPHGRQRPQDDGG